KEDIVLDFFAGSGSTGQAVLELNEETNGNRRFILVQMPEKTDEKSEAYKSGYKYISDITKTRLKKAIEILDKNKASQLEFEKKPKQGFRCFVLGSSNFKIWRGDVIENEKDLINQIELFKTPQKENFKE